MRESVVEKKFVAEVKSVVGWLSNLSPPDSMGCLTAWFSSPEEGWPLWN